MLHARRDQQLPWREQIAPVRHRRTSDDRVRSSSDRQSSLSARCRSLPIPAASRRSCCLNELRVVVLRPRRAVAALPLDLLLPGLRLRDDLPLEDDGIELLAHLAGLGLALHLVAIDDAPAARIGALRVAAGDGAFAVLLGVPDDLEVAPLSRGVRMQPDARAIGASRQFGESGIRPSQYGHVIVRAQR